MFFKGRFGQKLVSKVRFLDGLLLGLDRFFVWTGLFGFSGIGQCKEIVLFASFGHYPVK